MRHATLILTLLMVGSLCAQNPFAPLGKQAHVLSLSKGAYPEVFQNDTLRTICGMVYNRVTNQVIGFTEVDTLVSESGMKPELVSRWLSMDPLAAEYAPISPYAFALNNPLIFRDGDGRYVVGGDGRAVWFKRRDDGTIQWSSNATKDVMRIGNAMLETPTGERVFNAMRATAYPIGMVLSCDVEPLDPDNPQMGEYLFGLTSPVRDAGGKVTSANVTVYEGSIDQWLSMVDAGTLTPLDLNGQLIAEIGETEQVIGTTGAHEGTHASSARNLMESYQYITHGTRHDLEAEPMKVEMDAISELLYPPQHMDTRNSRSEQNNKKPVSAPVTPSSNENKR